MSIGFRPRLFAFVDCFAIGQALSLLATRRLPDLASLIVAPITPTDVSLRQIPSATFALVTQATASVVLHKLHN
jgi:hypothetical protein